VSQNVDKSGQGGGGFSAIGRPHFHNMQAK